MVDFTKCALFPEIYLNNQKLDWKVTNEQLYLVCKGADLEAGVILLDHSLEL